MHVSCPYCTSIFDVKRSDLGASGKQVQCGICEHEWFVDSTIYGDDSEIESDVSVDMFLDNASSPSLSYHNSDALALDQLPSGSMPSLMQYHQRVSRRNRYQGAFISVAWVILLILSFSLLAYATFDRDNLVEKFPALSKIYRTINLDVDDYSNIRSFAITDASFSVQFRNLERIVNISGTITNISAQNNVIPTLRISLNNIYGNEEYSTRIQMPANPLPAGGTFAFEHTIFNFPVTASDIIMLFLNRSEDLYTSIRLSNTDLIQLEDVSNDAIDPEHDRL